MKTMKNILVHLQVLLLTSLVAATLAPIHAQTPPATDLLFQTIQSLDAQLFDAYNHCDLEKFGSMLADDLEFYHDVGGFSRSRQTTVAGVKNNICGKVLSARHLFGSTYKWLDCSAPWQSRSR